MQPMKPEHHVAAGARVSSRQVFHLAQRLLLGEIAHAARVEQNDVGGGLAGARV